MVKKRKCSNQLEKDRQDNRERMSTFAQKKMEERDAKESQVEAPIETVDASVAPPKKTIDQLEDKSSSESEKKMIPAT
jgi:hypothetical protein